MKVENLIEMLKESEAENERLKKELAEVTKDRDSYKEETQDWLDNIADMRDEIFELKAMLWDIKHKRKWASDTKDEILELKARLWDIENKRRE